MKTRVVVAGVGMTQFVKPGVSDPYHVMGEKAARAALEDADLKYDDIEHGYVGYMYGDSTSGQASLYGVGLTGVPIFNVNNACATGSSALYLARQAVECGVVECALAVGFEQMNPGALGQIFDDRPSPMRRFLDEMKSLQPKTSAPIAAQLFGGAGLEFAEKYGIPNQVFAKISVKARAHAARNPFAVFRDELSLEEVMNSPHIFGPLTRYQCCPPTCGAAAAIVCTEAFARRNSVPGYVVIRGQTMTTDFDSTLHDRSMIKLVGFDMSKNAARSLYECAGVGPDDADVVELHDCFTTNELMTYEAIALTPEGTAARFVEDADNTYGGKVVTNPSGGLLSKGHPIGATGLAQCFELVSQLRGTAGKRQVEGARIALQHNLGLGGACVMTMYEAA